MSTNIYAGYPRRRGTIRISDTLPWFCVAAAFKYSYNYYEFIFPPLSGLFTMIYNFVTLILLLLYIPLVLKIIKYIRYKELKILRPTIFIPLMVLINIIYVILLSGKLGIISHSYQMSVAKGTNDYTGYYFSQINTWFGNMALVLLLVFYIKDKETIIRCIVATMSVLVFPTVLIAIMHPSYLGIRQSSFDGGVNFSGGLWNIGVVGFGSVSWLGLALIDYASKMQKKIIYFSILLFVFVGAAGISRTLILMVAFSVIGYFLLVKKDMSWIGKVALVMLAVLIFCILNPEFILSLSTRFTDKTAGTKNIRFLLWQAYMSHYKECWLIGAPEGSVYNYYRDVNLFGEYFLPHSALVNFFVRYGFVALVSYLILLKNSFLNIQKNLHVPSKSRVCILCGGIAYITLAFINQTGYAEIVFYIMFGLYLSYCKIEKGYGGE